MTAKQVSSDAEILRLRYVYQTEINRLRNALKALRTDICDYAEDTIWCGLGETVCDRITTILGDDWEA